MSIRSSYYIACALVLATAGGCRNEAEFTKSSGLTKSEEASLAKFVKPPKEVCSNTRAVEVKATSVPISWEGDKDGGVFPGAVTYQSGRLIVADAYDPSIFLYSLDGRLISKIGVRGKGPGEFQRISAITTDSIGRIYALEQERAVHIFDRDGRFIRSIPLRFPASDLAVLNEDNIILARQMPGKIPPKLEAPYVVIVNRDGQIQRSLLVANAKTVGQRPLPMAVTNPIRLTLYDRYLAVWYPYDYSVDVFHDWNLVSTVRGCMPAGTYQAFAAQRTDGTYQVGFQQISGVWVSASGEITVFRPATVDARSRIAVFSPDGRQVQELEMPPSRHAHILRNAVTLGNASDVLTFESDGAVNRWHFGFPQKRIRFSSH